MTQIYKIDHVISGMALNAIALGATNFVFLKFGDTAREVERLANVSNLDFWGLGGANADHSLVVLPSNTWRVEVACGWERSG